jgi:hypothetical protein
MIISAIIKEKKVFFNLHAEQTFTGTFQMDSGDFDINVVSGIYGSELTKMTLQKIDDYLKENNLKECEIYLDFNRIEDVQKNISELIETLNSSNNLFLLNINHKLVSKLGLAVIKHNVIDDITNSYQIFTIKQIQTNNEIIYEELFIEEFVKKLNIYTEKFENDKLHESSSVYINRFIDIKKMIVKDRSFFTYVLYDLAIKMNDKWGQKLKEEIENNSPILFCQNLNSSYITSILSSFLKWDILSIDHIGPVNKVYSNIGNKITSDSEYIVISDVVCLGTEVRICKNIINYSGGKYIGNASIVRINTLDGDHYKNTVSVFCISKDNNPIDYQIKTALSK